jgi:TolA-binding protein
VWSRHAAAGVETVVLVQGTLSIRVDHGVPSGHLLVVLPDGVLEDVGTTFSVTASLTQTTHVAVEEGTVVLRLRDAAPMVLDAGTSRFFSPRAPHFTASAPSGAPTAPAPPAVPAASAARRPPLASAAGSTHPSPPPASAGDEVGTAFRAAVTALDAGDATGAAALFAAFVSAHPHDVRSEDAAYLRVIALQRAGQKLELARAARDYVARYPHGFRAAEVEALTR